MADEDVSVLPTILTIAHQLPSGADFEALIFSTEGVRFFFTYRYIRKSEGGKPSDLEVVNNFKVILDYLDGILSNCRVQMHIIFPSKLGEQYLAGVDISPGAKVFVEFDYRQAGDDWIMKTATINNRPVDLDALRSAGNEPVKQAPFPFPILERLERTYGVFNIPFLDRNENEQQIQFRSSIRK